MTLALAALLLVQVQSADLEGVVVDGYPSSLNVRGPDGETTRLRMTRDDSRAWRWDGTPIDLEFTSAEHDFVRVGDRVRVDVGGEFFSPYSAGVAERIVVGPPPDPPDFGFVVAVEAWVVGQDPGRRATVRNLASRSWAVRERAARALRSLGREGAAGPLLWGLEAMGRDPEARDRIGGLRRAMWLEEVR